MRPSPLILPTTIVAPRVLRHRWFGLILILMFGVATRTIVLVWNTRLESQSSSSDGSMTLLFEPTAATAASDCNNAYSKVAIAYIAIGLLPRPDRTAPVFSWALHTLAAHGQFCGHVLIITDTPRRVGTLVAEVQRQHPHCRSTFHVIAVHPPFMVLHHTTDMYAKSFKTQMFEMLPVGVAEHVERILYLDSDILVVEPIDKALDRTFHDERPGTPTPPLKMIPGTATEQWHGGLLLLTRDAAACLQEWGHAIASRQFARDQIAIMHCPTCLDMVQPLPRTFLYFPDEFHPQLPPNRTFVHYTTTKRARKFMQHATHKVHAQFLQQQIGGIPTKCLDLEQVYPESPPSLSLLYDPMWYYGMFGEYSLSNCF